MNRLMNKVILLSLELLLSDVRFSFEMKVQQQKLTPSNNKKLTSAGFKKEINRDSENEKKNNKKSFNILNYLDLNVNINIIIIDCIKKFNFFRLLNFWKKLLKKILKKKPKKILKEILL
jgi:hypothetical protein